eukprot:scaffold194517_cov15-Tisochrysis_lutea.AAC.2
MLHLHERQGRTAAKELACKTRKPFAPKMVAGTHKHLCTGGDPGILAPPPFWHRLGWHGLPGRH